jgi:hypothetical protein
MRCESSGKMAKKVGGFPAFPRSESLGHLWFCPVFKLKELSDSSATDVWIQKNVRRQRSRDL